MQAKLISLDDEKTITIDKEVVLVGRKRGLCDVYVDRHSISKLHCLLIKTDGLLFFRDLASTNGTKVNGQKVIRGALLPGDELSFAGAKFRVHLGPDEEGENNSPLKQDEATEVMTSFPFTLNEPGREEAFEDSGSNSDSDVRLLSDDSAV